MTVLTRRQARQQGGLAPWSGAQVEPPAGRSRRSGECPRDELGTLILNARATLPDRGQLAWIATPTSTERGVLARMCPGRDQLPHGAEPWPDCQGDDRGGVVGRQGHLEFLGRQQIGIGVNDPPRVRGSQPQRISIIQAGGQVVHPASQVSGGDAPQHGVDEPSDPPAHRRCREIDGGRDGGRCGNPRGHQLMSAKPQQIDRGRLP